MNVYGYKVTYFIDYENIVKTERGLVVARHFSEAMERIVEMYGEQECEDIRIYCVEETIPVVTEETIRNLYAQWEEEDAPHAELEDNNE